MIIRLLIATCLAFTMASPAFARSETDRGKELTDNLGLHRFGAHPPRALPVRALDGGFRYDITDLARNLLKGAGGEHTVFQWLRQIYGYGDPFELELRSALPVQGNGVSAGIVEMVADFHARENVRTEWSSREKAAPGALLVYLIPQAREASAGLPPNIKRSCALRACAIIRLDPGDAEAMAIAIERFDFVLGRIERPGAASSGMPVGVATIIDGEIHIVSSPLGNLRAIEDTLAAFWTQETFIVSEPCGLILETDLRGTPTAAGHLCIMDVMPGRSSGSAEERGVSGFPVSFPDRNPRYER